MKKMTIFQRIAFGFLVLLSVITALGIYSTLKLGQLSQLIQSISTVDSETIRVANRLRNTFLTHRKYDKMYVVSGDQDFYVQMRETKKYLDRDLKEIGSLVEEPEKSRLVDHIDGDFDSYLAIVEKEAGFLERRESFSRELYEEKKAAHVERIIRRLDVLADSAETSIENKIDFSGQVGYQALQVVVILTLASLFVGLAIAFYNARTISRPLLSLIRGTKEIARGNFEAHLSVPSPPEMNELAQAFNQMSDRLKELDQIKADLISYLSHEFRTPLAVMREAVHLQRESIASGSVEKQQKLLGITEEECERLIRSVDKILNLSRMNGGMMEYQIEACSISQVIERGVSKVAPIAERKKIRLDVELSGNLPQAAVDKEKIGQVLDNLLDNALKFTAEGGRISVTASPGPATAATTAAGSEKRMIEISVSDSGCGIPPENRSDVFNKFEGLDEKGTGLGLYIARQMVRAHGGDIWVESEEEKGSTFSFTVPAF